MRAVISVCARAASDVASLSTVAPCVNLLTNSQKLICEASAKNSDASSAGETESVGQSALRETATERDLSFCFAAVVSAVSTKKQRSLVRSSIMIW